MTFGLIRKEKGIDTRRRQGEDRSRDESDHRYKPKNVRSQENGRIFPESLPREHGPANSLTSGF